MPRYKRNTYRTMQAVKDSLAYIAEGIGEPYPQRPLEILSDAELMTVQQWAMKLQRATESEIAARPSLPGVPLYTTSR